MSITNTASLIETKNKLKEVESSIEDLMTDLIRKKKHDFSRTNDHGVRGFVLHIHFDTLNIDAFKHAEKIKGLYEQFVILKKLQIKQEEQYDTETLIVGQMKNDVKGMGDSTNVLY